MSRTVQTLLPYFGGNRTHAKTVGELLKGCRWVGIPFAGGMPELLHIDAQSIVVSDLHRHVINLAQCIAIPELREWMIAELNAAPFHPDVLASAQQALKEWDWTNEETPSPDGTAAFYYFITQWMGRSGQAGTDKEFTGNLSVRRNANGGDSNKRFRSAVDGIAAFQSVMRRCNFVCEDCFDFLDKVQDVDGHGVYCDPPWPEAGAAYVHSVDDEAFHFELRQHLDRFYGVRVVIRYGEHPLIRELYDNSPHWTIHEVAGRTQGRNKQMELLIVNRVLRDGVQP